MANIQFLASFRILLILVFLDPISSQYSNNTVSVQGESTTNQGGISTVQVNASQSIVSSTSVSNSAATSHGISSANLQSSVSILPVSSQSTMTSESVTNGPDTNVTNGTIVTNISTTTLSVEMSSALTSTPMVTTVTMVTNPITTLVGTTTTVTNHESASSTTDGRFNASATTAEDFTYSTNFYVVLFVCCIAVAGIVLAAVIFPILAKRQRKKPLLPRQLEYELFGPLYADAMPMSQPSVSTEVNDNTQNSAATTESEYVNCGELGANEAPVDVPEFIITEISAPVVNIQGLFGNYSDS